MESIALQLAKIIHNNEWLIKLLPNYIVIKTFSFGRNYFMDEFINQPLSNINKIVPDASLWQRKLWGLTFQSPLMNSAGMFKNGDGYDIVARQGAGGYIGGTSTYNPRNGNTKSTIHLPFISLPISKTTVNYLGLPNLGDDILSKHIFTKNKQENCPIGWSIMRSPDEPSEQTSLQNLITSLFKYQDNPQIDFIEINESCPNVGATMGNIKHRLKYISQNFLQKRTRTLPVILKFSNDINIESLEALMIILFKYKFDGINIGNTSTSYQKLSLQITNSKERKLFQYFTSKFNGGVGGQLLKNISLELCKKAVEYRNNISPDYEFHVIRTGGIDSLADIFLSDKIGVSLNQWYSGYFTNYIKHGNDIYKNFY